MDNCDGYNGMLDEVYQVADKPFIVKFARDGEKTSEQFDTEEEAREFVKANIPQNPSLLHATFYGYQGKKWVNLQQQKAPKDGVFTARAS